MEKKGVVYQKMIAAIEQGTVFTRKDLREIRESYQRSVLMFKGCFWLSVALFNLLIWVELPINRELTIALGILSLLTALLPPIIGIKTFQKRLYLLEECDESPKKSRASDAGKRYIEGVKAEERPFLRVEFELLEKSREL